MPIKKPDYQLPEKQLTLPLDLEDLQITGVKSQVPTPEEARLRSEAARQAFDGESFPWMVEYRKLREGGWDWRVAAYIAWASSPRSSRQPKNQDELARGYLGLTSDRAVSSWRRKNPAIDEMVAVLQSSALWEARAEIYEALIAVATSPEYKGHNDRKLALELLGDYVPAAKLEAILKQKGSQNDPDVEDEDKLALLERSAKEMIKDLAGEPDESAEEDE